MNIAVIDIGTNTFDLLISKIEKGNRQVELHNSKSSVRLGSGIMKKILLDEAMQRGIDTLKNFKDIIHKFNCSKIYAFATSAVRDASNKQVFIDRVKNETGIEIRVISGDKEAEYIYSGVKNALDIGNEKSLIMDIGGGSIEFIIANRGNIFWEESYNIGVARLLAKFKISDPIQPEEQSEVEKYLELELTSLFDAVVQYPIETLIGSSGSFDTFAEVIANRFYTPKILLNKTEYTFNSDEYLLIHEQLITSSLEDRKQTKGIIEMRLDMIVTASVITNFILKKLNIFKMRLSTYSMKEGILWEVMQMVG